MKDVGKSEQTKDDKKTESKDENKEQSTNQEQSTNLKKEEVSYDLGTSEMEQSDDDHKKMEQIKRERIEKDLDQVNNFEPVQSSLMSNNIVKSLSLEPV